MDYLTQVFSEEGSNMTEFDEKRPDPDLLLASIGGGDQDKRGKLKIFFGYAAGVGKTYAMLDEAQEQFKSGLDVLVGYVEPHTRPETMHLLAGLPVLPPKTVEYRNIKLKEFDLEAALRKRPHIILVDELAHTNAEGVRNKKRYQDVEELLNAGIDVYSTVNVQHIESLSDVVQNITKAAVRETIPDYIFDSADKIKLIDIEPDELIKRFQAGKIYDPERAITAMTNFFTKENLRLLREIAMRKAADRLSYDNQNERTLTEKMASIKLLVCVGTSQSSARGIRWTARTAEAFHAPWVAVYVENIESQYLSEVEKQNIRENLELAERLGAETVTLTCDDIAVAIKEYAKLSGITNIVIGKSRNRKTLKRLFEKTLEDKLITALPSIEVHIIPDITGERKPQHKTITRMIGNNLFFSWQDAGKTIFFITAATLLSIALRRFEIGDQNIIMIYILSVLIISRSTMGYMYSTISSVLSVLAFNFFFTEPYYSFSAIRPGYPVTFLIMLIVALITSALTVRIQTQVRLAVQRERRTGVLYEINKKLLITRGRESVVTLVNNYIIKLFDRSVIFYAHNPSDSVGDLLQSSADSDASFMLLEEERAVAHWVFVNQKYAGAGTDTLMGAGALYVPIISQGKSLGVIGLSCARGKFSQTNRLFLLMITSQIAMALERQDLSDEHRRILVEQEKEKMRSNLLRAISHDLRTPLTGIFGASSAILENKDSFDNQTFTKLMTNIKDDSQWLIRMVENILSVTRLDEENMNVKKMPEAAEEIAAEAVSRIRKRFPDRQITVIVPDTLLIVPMDGILIEQVLINLIENAAKHSPDDSMIRVVIQKKGNYAQFEVIDNGEGIEESDIPYLFESYKHSEKRNQDSTRGKGIGLSICMSIIKAHDGKMEAANNKTGGAVFRFMLPLKEDEGYG
jgi:two-component system, OmpR family, sensor histidine kinase KdpD